MTVCTYEVARHRICGREGAWGDPPRCERHRDELAEEEPPEEEPTRPIAKPKPR